jgi:hypothetical protein
MESLINCCAMPNKCQNGLHFTVKLSVNGNMEVIFTIFQQNGVTFLRLILLKLRANSQYLRRSEISINIVDILRNMNLC